MRFPFSRHYKGITLKAFCLTNKTKSHYINSELNEFAITIRHKYHKSRLSYREYLLRRSKRIAKMADDPLVWIDCEMTGLDVDNEHIIEIAVLITDGKLNILAEGPDLVINQSQETMDKMNDWCKQHHGDSGLTAAVLSSTITTSDASAQILEFLKKHIPDKGIAPLAGNSVYADKMFLKKEMPEVVDWLHYRIVDVSSIKELCRRWYPSIFETAPKKKSTHRALDDIKESINELKFYKKHIFIDESIVNSAANKKRKEEDAK
ncbi:11870_t:CDS:2 [Gigaspora rosea]|nr:11870_t:CDS:2 [Gigaspora rosea]